MLRRILLPLLGLVLLVTQPGATWSIVCVNTRTHEVGVASATCIENFNLRNAVPVIFVGEGAAAAQSFIDTSGQNRRTIYFDFRDTDKTPAEILAELAAQDPGHQTRQYGIANFTGDPVTFTGTGDGRAANGVTGRVGDIAYAIQGNVLTGDAVVFAAEAAFRTKKGDMGQKMMAAMEAARALGGDGRCSCDPSRPTSCGVPPPNFSKSAHVGVVIVARVGDTNAGCNSNRGCAQGDYYLNLNVIGDASDPDPVFTLFTRYDKWRKQHRGRPDGVTTLLGGVKALPADGVTVRTITVELHDVEDLRLTHGGATLEVKTADGLAPLATVGPVSDLGNGRYTFTLTAGTTPGLDRFVITATDVSPIDPADIVTATLYPPLEIQTIATDLLASSDQVSAASGAGLAFVVNRADKPLAPYMLVARLVPSSLRAPGRLLPGAYPLLPIPQSPFYPAAPLTLDARGRSETVLDLPPGLLEPLIGRRIQCTGLVLDGPPLEATDTAGFEIVP